MAFLRHATRHIHYTVANRLAGHLDELGWTASTSSERPFGTDIQVKVRHSSPIADGNPGDIFPGLCAITVGSEAPPMEEELGGPLATQDIPIFVDLLMDESSLALALACDVRDILLGRLEGSRSVFPVVDQSTQTPAPGWLIRLEDVERERPETQLSLHWQVVKVTAAVEFNEGTF